VSAETHATVTVDGHRPPLQHAFAATLILPRVIAKSHFRQKSNQESRKAGNQNCCFLLSCFLNSFFGQKAGNHFRQSL
jgi:hypothetical protein